jgi:hypothetical protein
VPGEKHDTGFHKPMNAAGVEIFSAVDDCIQCAGAQYGAEITLYDAYGDLRGQPRMAWEGGSR